MRFRDRVFSPPWRLIAISFLMDFCSAMTMLAVQNLGIHLLGAPPAVLGLFATLGAVAYTTGCLLLGGISDRYGRRRCAVLGCLGVAAAWSLIPNARHYHQVLLIVPLSGLSLSCFWPTVLAWLSELGSGDRRELTRNLGLFNIMWCTGFMFGPLVTGYLWGTSPPATFYLPAAIALGIAAALTTIPRGQARARVDDQDGAAENESADLFLRLAWIGNFVAFFATATVMAMFPKLGVTIGFTDPQVGWLLFVMRLGQLAAFLYTRYEHRWQYRLWPLLMAEVLSAAGMVVAVFTSTHTTLALAFALAGACGGLTYVSSLFYSLHGRPARRGKNAGIHEAMLGSGAFLGPLLGGLAAQWLSLRAPFVVAAAVLFLGCLSQLTVLRRGAWLVASRRSQVESQTM